MTDNHFNGDDLHIHIFSFQNPQWYVDAMAAYARKPTREEIECSSDIQTSITDMDMLLLQIDGALEANDKERFMMLTERLRGLEGVE